jgi:hypothetical protein
MNNMLIYEFFLLIGEIKKVRAIIQIHIFKVYGCVYLWFRYFMTKAYKLYHIPKLVLPLFLKFKHAI